VRILLAVLTLSAVTAAHAVASTRADRVAASDAVARRTLSLHRQIQAADARAVDAREARRTAAQGCLAVWQSAPAARREDLQDIYFWYLSGGLWSVDAPLYGSWISDLRRSKRVDRAPVLARAADTLRNEYADAAFIYHAFPDACATVTAWRDAGWSDAASPIASLKPPALDEKRHERIIREAAAQLRRYSRLWDRIGTLGIDEIDARVHATDSCDRVGDLLFPYDYDGCAQ
jgi:hypothetical protein